MTAIGDKFSIVPIEAISDPELTPSEFKVLVALYSFRDKNADTSFPKLESLATRAGFRDATQVSKITSRLETKGWLTKRQKMGFHGPKKYRLSIPERLTQSGEIAQLGRIAQLGSSNADDLPNLEDLSNLESLATSNLEESSNSQLGQNYQGYKNIPVGTDQKEQTSSDAAASATRVANAVDNFETLGAAYRSPSAEQIIFNRGAALLGQHGIADQAARRFLGMCKQQSGAGRTLDAVVVTLLSQPSGDPKAFMLGVLANQPAEIPGTWEPDPGVVGELEGLGIPMHMIRNARDAFVVWFSDMEIRHSNWPRLFKDWVIRDWERAEFNAQQYRSNLAKSAGLVYARPFQEPA